MYGKDIIDAKFIFAAAAEKIEQRNIPEQKSFFSNRFCFEEKREQIGCLKIAFLKNVTLQSGQRISLCT
jgi:hypothetical protein